MVSDFRRLTPRAARTGRSGTPSPATPLAFVLRDDLGWLLRAVRLGDPPQRPVHGASGDLLDALEHAMDWNAWNGLREDRRRSPTSAERVMALTATSLLA